MSTCVNTTKKVSCVTCTFRRFHYIQRIISMFECQDYPNKELIIFNTDTDFPLELSYVSENIRIINNSIDFVTNKPYKNVGSIRRDALTFADGDLHFTFDDDDVYLPWFITQAVEGILESGKKAWKPEYSFFKTRSKLELMWNYLEASVLVDVEELRKIGFKQETGSEGLSWYNAFVEQGELDQHSKNYIPSYCFDWSDPYNLAPHKQSGDIKNPNCFEDHKISSFDIALRPLERIDLKDTYIPFYNYLKEHKTELNQDYYEKYFIEKF